MRLQGRLLSRGGIVRLILVAALVAAYLSCYFGSPYLVSIAEACVIFGIAAVGQAVLIGHAGQVAISGAAFMAVGAFTTGLCVRHGDLPFPLPLIISVVIGWVIGMIAGVPGLRFRGIYLLLASLALQQIVVTIAQWYEDSHAVGGLLIPTVQVGSLTVEEGPHLLLLLAIVLVIVLALVGWLYRSRTGLRWVAIRESELASSVTGLRIAFWKVQAFAVSGAITACAGSLFGYWSGVADVGSFQLTLAISLITMVYIGGSQSVLGALVGAVVVTATPYVLQSQLQTLFTSLGVTQSWFSVNVGNVSTALFAALFLLVIIYEPDGIEGLLRRIVGAVLAVGSRRRARADRGPRAAAYGSTGRRSSTTNDRAVTSSTALLDVRSLTVRYGSGEAAVAGLDLTVEPGQINVILGRNGAGKTSALRGIVGFLNHERVTVDGQVSVRSTPIRRRSPLVMGRHGVILVPERDKVFRAMDVRSQLVMTGGAAHVERAVEAFPRLGDRLHTQAGLLSGGERQMLALALALVRDPTVLLVDELSLGLAPRIVEELVDRLRQLVDSQQIGLILVDQAASSVVRAADTVIVMDRGDVVSAGPAQDVDLDAVTRVYLGV
jgi:ABC-type branched-subunit amino acid transport system ATPase component/ABC-type branched-subunit amino acid transport system permease subunit